MRVRPIVVLAALAVAISSAPAHAQSAPATASAKPLRHLVFAFHYGVNTNIEEHNSGFNGGEGNGLPLDQVNGTSGITNYSQSNGDEGTITVDVLREQPDHGLVLSVGEDARTSRTADPTTCVVYGNGSFICDPNKTLHLEEASVLRFLGSNFVDAALIGPGGDWSFHSSSPTYTADSTYRISKHAGSVLTIDEQRNITLMSTGKKSAVVTSTLTYDSAHSVPLSIQEVTTNRTDDGMSHYQTARTQVDLTLTSDSMGALASTH